MRYRVVAEGQENLSAHTVHAHTHWKTTPPLLHPAITQMGPIKSSLLPILRQMPEKVHPPLGLLSHGKPMLGALCFQPLHKGLLLVGRRSIHRPPQVLEHRAI